MKIIFSILALMLCMTCSSATLYISQNGLGTANGSTSNNAMSQASYGTGASGNTYYFVGTITNAGWFMAANSTFKFLPNAKFSAPTWYNYLIIMADGCTVDGQSVGLIESTANGTGLLTSNNVAAIIGNASDNCLVANLTIRNLYQYAGPNDRQPNNNGAGTGVSFYSGTGQDYFHDNTVSNCVIYGMSIGIGVGYNAGCYNVRATHCTVSNCNWDIQFGDSGGATSAITNVTVDHCNLSRWANWDEVGNLNHHNGLFAFSANNGKIVGMRVYGNYVGPGYGNENTSGFYFSGDVSDIRCHNNFFDNTDGSGPANGDIYVLSYIGASPTTNYFVNNTFASAAGVNMIYLEYGNSQATTFNNVLNNMFATTGSATQNSIVVGHHQYMTPASDTNCFYNVAKQLFSISYTAVGGGQPLATWQAYGLNLDTHSLTNNPLLDASFKPGTSSPLHDAGMNFTSLGITEDYDGNPRPATGAWTIGAFQKVVTATNTTTTAGRLLIL